MSVDFTSLLATQIDTIEKPKPLPIGHYVALVTKYETGESSAKKTPYMRVHFKLLEPMEDVDAQLLEEFGGAAKLAERNVSLDFYLTPDALFRLREFLEKDLGLEGTGRSIGDVMEECLNQTVKVLIGQRANPQKPGEFYTQVEKTLKA